MVWKFQTSGKLYQDYSQSSLKHLYRVESNRRMIEITSSALVWGRALLLWAPNERSVQSRGWSSLWVPERKENGIHTEDFLQI